MKLALISDTHFGDPAGTLIEADRTGKLVPGPKYEEFKKATGKRNDYLILLGDILDFAVSSYGEAYTVAKAFFLQVQRDGIADQMVFVPGNHDVDIWHIVEHQVNIIHQIAEGRSPRKFRMSVPGVIDDRTGSRHRRLLLPGVTEKTFRGKRGYGRLFLDYITVPQGRPTRFSFAYPNVYLVTDEESVLLTHGHYFEGYWSAISEWAPRIFENDFASKGRMTMGEMVALNFPSNQLACSGVGQAGALTQTIRTLQAAVDRHDLTKVSGYLGKLRENVLSQSFGSSFVDPRRWVVAGMVGLLNRRVLAWLKKVDDARYSKEFINKPAVRERFKRFYERSHAEIDWLNQTYGYGLPLPTRVIFGHTHQPIPWGSEEIPEVAGPHGVMLRVFNSGGWIFRNLGNREKEFCGAEVFKYSTGQGFSSVPIR